MIVVVEGHFGGEHLFTREPKKDEKQKEIRSSFWVHLMIASEFTDEYLPFELFYNFRYLTAGLG